MTIKNKIRLSNVLMVLIPIFVTLVVITVCINTSLGSYYNTIESMYNDENGIQFAQSMLYNYQKELWEYNWVLCENSNGESEICQNEKMTKLGDTLSDLGYKFMIMKQDNQIYSNLSENEINIGREVAGNAIDFAKTLTASRNDISVIKNTFWHGDEAFCIIAIHPYKTDGVAINCLKNYLKKYVYGIITFFIILTVILNGVLSWWLSKSILNPLKYLQSGIKNIKDGNLDLQIDYQKKDEFGQACSDFNDMRMYLKASAIQRLEDEKKRRSLITGISHDLRTPLTSISGYVDGLIDGIADTPDKVQRYLTAIKIRTGNMVNLVESLSEYTRFDSNFKYYMERTDIKDFVNNYIDTYKGDIEHNNINLTTRYSKDNLNVKLDKKEFKRVFDNLFTNTVKYRNKDISQVMITIKYTIDMKWIEISYQDDGPGVPDDNLDKIFDSFYRVDSARNRVEKGSGIGLAVVKEIVNGHKGSVFAENRDGLAIIIHLPESREENNE